MSKQFSSVEEVLAHSGVKGMRWGVRKEYESVDESASKQAYISAIANQKPLTAEEATAKRNKAAVDFAKKVAPSEADTPKGEGLTPGQKKALLIGGGVLATAAILGGAYAYKKYGQPQGLPTPANEYLDQLRKANEFAYMKGTPRIHPSAFDRKGFTLPAGHEFRRISSTVENSFADTTYANFNIPDYNRYLGEGFGRMIDKSPLHLVTFSAKEEIKVPSLTTTLDTLRDVMSSAGKAATREDAITEYSILAGSDFMSKTGEGLLSALKSKGYAALVDEADAGRVGDLPLVMFGKERLTSKKSTLLTRKDVQKAQQAMLPLKNLKVAETIPDLSSLKEAFV